MNRRRWFLAAVVLLLGITVICAVTFKRYGAEFAKAMHYGVMNQKMDEAWRRIAATVGDQASLLWLHKEAVREDGAVRRKLPDFRTIAALRTESMTPHIAEPATTDWQRSSGDNASSKFSAANLITKSNVNDLKLAWEYSTPDAAANIQATPIYTGKAIVFPDARNFVVALDPTNGAKIWEFDPQIPQPALRGLTFLQARSGRQGLVFFSARGRLFALDSESGKPNVGFAGGSVAVGSTIKVAPAFWNDMIIVSSTEPALHAFDIASGRHAWTITLRLDDDVESATGYEGGVNWGGFSVDSERGLAFVSTSNPSPVGFGGQRPGRNPGTSAIIAVDLTKRRIAWEFQEIAHDLWDLDIAAAPVLATIMRDGKSYDVVVVATKVGNIIVLDRPSGRPVFDYRLRRAPVSMVPGEITDAYQPDLELPDPVGRFEFSLSDVTDIGDRNRDSVLAQLRHSEFGFYTPHVPGRPTVFFGLHGGTTQFGPALDPASQTLIVAANRERSSFSIADATSERQPLAGNDGALASYERHCSSCHGTQLQGGQGPALKDINRSLTKQDVQRIVRDGLRSMPAVADITEQELAALLEGLFSEPKTENKAGAQTTTRRNFARTTYTKLKDLEGYPGSKPPWGTLQAIDLNTGHTRWRVPLGHYDELLARGIPITGTPNFRGPMITATGLAFVSGTKDRLVRAFDIHNGAQLWAHRLPHIGSATPMTYIHGGRQYILIPATGGGTLAIYDRNVTTGSSFLAFALQE